jgi:hypothetical protein
VPVRKVKGGYRFGRTGKIHKTKKAADRQARGNASGYGKKKKTRPKKRNRKKAKR